MFPCFLESILFSTLFLRQDLCFWLCTPGQLTVEFEADSPVSTCYLTVGVLGLQMWATAFGFLTCVLGIKHILVISLALLFVFALGFLLLTLSPFNTEGLTQADAYARQVLYG